MTLDLVSLVEQSFVTEVTTFKPGNVSIQSAGHQMHANDFLKSAKLVSPILCDTKRTLAQRILDAVTTTQENVGCNTNLGMLLLYAPIIASFYLMESDALDYPKRKQSLQKGISVVLNKLDTSTSEAQYIYKAIQTALPGGLGERTHYDIHDKPPASILTAMQYASSYDRIAWQYHYQFSDIFGAALSVYEEQIKNSGDIYRATLYAYISLLHRIPDSLIQRKFGKAIAAHTQNRAFALWNQLPKRGDKKNIPYNQIFKVDKAFKKANINPGTTADLTSAVILVYNIASSSWRLEETISQRV